MILPLVALNIWSRSDVFARMLAFAIVVAVQLYAPAEHPALSIEHRSFELDNLPIRVSFPAKSERPLPVFVFSHGMYGSRDGYGPLVDAIAGNGYLVIQMTHADSVTKMSQAERAALLRNPNTNRTQNWKERPREVSQCIDALALIARKAGVAADPARVAVGGHSYGAWTTQCLAGMEISNRVRSVEFKDPRPIAFVVLSPHGPGAAVTEESLSKMRGPMLMVTGSKDDSPRGETAAWRRRAFEVGTRGDRHLIWIEGAAHNFGGLTGDRNELVLQFMQRAGSSVSRDDSHVAIAKSAVVAFLDTYVKQDRAAKQYWTSKRLAAAGKVSIESK